MFKKLLGIMAVALLFAAPAQAGWQSTKTSIQHSNCLQWNGPTYGSYTNRTSGLAQMANGGSLHSYKDKIDGSWGVCRGINDGFTIHFRTTTCPSEGLCPDVAGAIARAENRLENDKNCPGKNCSVQGEDWWKYQVNVVDWEMCVHNLYEVTLKVKKHWLWSDPGDVEYEGNYGYLAESWDIEGCGDPPGGGGNW